MFQRALDVYLIDVVWLRHCPALAPLRSLDRFAPLAALLEQRAAAPEGVSRRGVR